MDSAEHFGQQAEVLWYYSAFGIVHGDVFITDAAVRSPMEGRSRKVSFPTHVTKYWGILLCCHYVVSLDVHSVCSHTSTGLCTGTLQTLAVLKKNPTRCNNVSKFYYSTFIWSSTCFGRHTAHHQEPKTALAASGFSYVKGCWTRSWWTLSGTVWEGAVCRLHLLILCLTTSTIYTSNNLTRMKNQRLPVQF